METYHSGYDEDPSSILAQRSMDEGVFSSDSAEA
jgi:hypothetical protein